MRWLVNLVLRWWGKPSSARERVATHWGWHDYTLRFDVVAVDLDEKGCVVQIEHIPDSF